MVGKDATTTSDDALFLCLCLSASLFPHRCADKRKEKKDAVVLATVINPRLSHSHIYISNFGCRKCLPISRVCRYTWPAPAEALQTPPTFRWSLLRCCIHKTQKVYYGRREKEREQGNEEEEVLTCKQMSVVYLESASGIQTVLFLFFDSLSILLFFSSLFPPSLLFNCWHIVFTFTHTHRHTHKLYKQSEFICIVGTSLSWWNLTQGFLMDSSWNWNWKQVAQAGDSSTRAGTERPMDQWSKLWKPIRPEDELRAVSNIVCRHVTSSILLNKRHGHQPQVQAQECTGGLKASGHPTTVIDRFVYTELIWTSLTAGLFAVLVYI